ncbi:nucleoside deaminase [Aureibaculum sp. 2210JD6-5]|uniref:nucleoside deaminase n=1 Tax=Aureibaculum sp. 2210JD6-5 TaxID=3103957 RepID=UPI002AAE844D|nr:nucleoside deaminase [Aureibaculum sp. 2210JD6-5]MDY7393925.1 nucleoside deaminase [Aureibaculum sp. 2210JD6-5]
MCNQFNKKFLDEAAKAQSDNENLSDHELFMNEAIQLAIDGMNANEGGPFGCVIVKDGKIVGRGNNKVTSNNDPTAHAEVTAIRDACQHLKSFQLEGCTIYTSCEPCPMCLGAIYWARPDKVYFGCNHADAAKVGFDDSFIYKELDLDFDKRSIPFQQISRNDALTAFKKWSEKEDKTVY